ncbi:MAG TPA: acyl-CoA reductase [Verrucomicrobiae bacterium]|nr:acyl-CoA reductase [Verrucomicrobiae bacterium]
MSVTAEQIREAMSRTREARERVWQHRTTDAVITMLAQAAKNWLDPKSSWRQRATEQAPTCTGFSEAMVNEAVDLVFGAITYESLGELLDRELGNRRVLDEFCLRGRVQTRGTPPRLIAHFLAGNVPAPGIVSLCCGLLLRSANLVKVSTHDPVFPTLFLESVREVDADLADCAAMLDWPRGELALTQTMVGDADAVIAYGTDSTVSALRQLAPASAKFLGYGHKISFAVVAKEAMTAENLPQLAQAAAFDASVYDQQGCLSPHVFYVEERGQLGPRKFAAALADAMAAYQARVPRGQLSVQEAAEFARFRTGYEFAAASDRRIGVWASPSGNDWAVIYDDSPAFVASCLNRVVFVKPTDGYKRVLDAIQKFASQLSTVGVAPMNERAAAFASDLTRMGVHRVCPIGQMQHPPLSWHHDGRPNLADLVSWTDLG